MAKCSNANESDSSFAIQKQQMNVLCALEIQDTVAIFWLYLNIRTFLYRRHFAAVLDLWSEFLFIPLSWRSAQAENFGRDWATSFPIFAKKHSNECKLNAKKEMCSRQGKIQINQDQTHGWLMMVRPMEINIMLLAAWVVQATGKMSGRNELCKIIFCNICYAR